VNGLSASSRSQDTIYRPHAGDPYRRIRLRTYVAIREEAKCAIGSVIEAQCPLCKV
jgi:hypothetical protein